MPNKIGWHKNGSGGHAAGLSEALARQDAAGVRFTVNCVDDAGLAAYAASFTNTDHVIVFRKTAWSGAPNYNNPAREEAIFWWTRIIRDMPPELVPFKDRIWIEPINEPDKERANWIGYFMLNLAQLANEQGWKVCGPSWATGNPEYDHYETPGQLEWFRYTAANPTKAAQAVHEYSLVSDELNRWYPYLIGRFESYMFDVCDANGIGRPPVIVTELGWTLDNMPEPARAMEQINWVADVYDAHPQVLGTCLWTLGSGSQWGSLPAKLERLINPVTDWSIDRYEGGAPDPPSDRTPNRIKHTIHLLPQNTSVAELVDVAGFLHGTRSAFTYSHDVVEAVMYHSTPEGRIVVWEPQRWPFNTREYFSWLGVQYEERYIAALSDPLHDLRLAAPFGKPFAITSSFNAPRSYANGKHEGADYDVIGGPAESLEPVLAIHDGTVVESQRRTDGYGHTVITEFQHNGRTLRIWYCHLDSRLFSVGDKVRTGQPIGEVGSTGGTFAEHVHINLQLIGGGLSGYYIPNVVDPAPYISMVPQTPAGYDMLNYFAPAGGATHGDLVILANNWGQGDERQQLQRDGDILYVVKNRQWERRRLRGDLPISFEVDTSPNDSDFYTVSSATGWIPRRWLPGNEFVRTETAVFYRKSDCAQLTSFGGSSILRFANHYDRFTTRGGIVINDVIEVQWIRNGEVEETYWYGAGLGLVQWENKRGNRSTATELIKRGNQSDNTRQMISCPQI